jgi:hypothetical protein
MTAAPARMPATRLQDWEPALHTAIDAAAARPFKFGDHDCCLFIADVVLVLTGHDFGAGFRGKYRTAAGAMKALRRAVGDSASTPAALRWCCRSTPA